MASVPARSCLARQGWLKKTTLSPPVSSRTVTLLDHGAAVAGRPGAGLGAPRPARPPPSPTCRGPRRLALAGAVDVALLAREGGRMRSNTDLDARARPAGPACWSDTGRRGPTLSRQQRAQGAQRAPAGGPTRSRAGTGRPAGPRDAPRARRRGTPLAQPLADACRVVGHLGSLAPNECHQLMLRLAAAGSATAWCTSPTESATPRRRHARRRSKPPGRAPRLASVVVSRTAWVISAGTTCAADSAHGGGTLRAAPSGRAVGQQSGEPSTRASPRQATAARTVFVRQPIHLLGHRADVLVAG